MNRIVPVATTAMTGSRLSLMPSHMRRGRVNKARPPMKMTTISSSQEWMKAKIAPDSTPGRMLGTMTQRSVWLTEAPNPRDACSSRGSRLASAPETVSTT